MDFYKFSTPTTAGNRKQEFSIKRKIIVPQPFLQASNSKITFLASFSCFEKMKG
jgi:hypothetical protein